MSGIETVAVTGGNGFIGEVTLAHLADRGYRTANLARGKRREDVADEYRRTDLEDAGEVYGSLAASDADAVIHLGTIPAPTRNPGYVTYRNNVDSTYHVLEAATELGLEAVCVASSINAMGCAYQDEPTEIDYLPVDEDHPLTPRDPYAVAKHAMEVTADGFGRRSDAPQVASLRFPWVADDDDLRESYATQDRSLEALSADAVAHGRDHLFSYLHVEDAASVARRAVEADLEGHEAFWTVAADTSVETPSADLAAEVYPDLPVRTDVEGTESLISIEKAADLLDWTPERSWRELR
jgi:nucleoside-diphosphate-sugar epimerase